ncbi:MAG: transporter suffix domain-containing protein [Deltaproteobacteria bacterium]|nr:transporter suffix domain-containing protein [Deltaproteobacteria bacterium]
MNKLTPNIARTAPAWRFRLGVLLFLFGLICPIFIPLVTATDLPAGWKALLSGLLSLGVPELLWLIAAAVMGKEGFDRIKHRFFKLFKKVAPPDKVSRTRYRIGLVMFTLPLLLGWSAPYASRFIPGYDANYLAYAVAGDFLLVGSLFVLGGIFWDKLRALFVHGAGVRFAER